MNKLDHVHPKFNTTLLLPFKEPVDRTNSSCPRRSCRRKQEPRAPSLGRNNEVRLGSG